MLKSLHLVNVGPAREMRLDFGSRLNLITGDNGLGKSFILDAAWWALTRKWPREVNPLLVSGYRAAPRDVKRQATITFEVEAKTHPVAYTSEYVPRDEAWTGKPGRPHNPGLVIYAHSDGAFSVWDPARNYWRTKAGVDVQERLPAYVFSPQDVWDGLRRDDRNTVDCNGLLADVSSWQLEGGKKLDTYLEILRQLSPETEPGEVLRLGPPGRLSLDDARPVPTIGSDRSGFGLIVHASAGIRRIAALGYMLAWSWWEHRTAAIEKLGEDPAQQVTLLIDEIETHLHPRWQRRILGTLVELANEMHFDARSIQIIATTHSPLVLASTEPFFDEASDAWFDLDLELTGEGYVPMIRRRPYVRRGDVTNWLTSEAFDLESGRSLQAGTAIRRAKELLVRSTPPTDAELAEVDQLLQKARLPDTDAFAARWTLYKRERGYQR